MPDTPPTSLPSPELAAPDLIALAARIAAALDRLAPPLPPPVDLHAADAFVWHPVHSLPGHAPGPWLAPVAHVAAVSDDLLQGIERQKALLMENTWRFTAGLPANNAMLWGARGMGKSSLVKAAHQAANARAAITPGTGSLVLIEIHREDLRTLPDLLGHLRGGDRACLVFCDDLSFESQDADYKALKSVLDGGIEGRPRNVLFYATSNRRHLMPRDMIENERSSAINPNEAVEEKVSLSDRFGLWIGFHNCDQETFFQMVEGYAARYALPIDTDALHAGAVEWSVTRGGRSGRVAWQFIQDLAGRLGVAIEA